MGRASLAVAILGGPLVGGGWLVADSIMVSYVNLRLLRQQRSGDLNELCRLIFRHGLDCFSPVIAPASNEVAQKGLVDYVAGSCGLTAWISTDAGWKGLPYLLLLNGSGIRLPLKVGGILFRLWPRSWFPDLRH